MTTNEKKHPKIDRPVVNFPNNNRQQELSTKNELMTEYKALEKKA